MFRWSTRPFSVCPLLLFILFNAQLSCGEDTECSIVTVTGTSLSSQSGRVDGKYNAIGKTRGGRPVFKHLDYGDKDDYIYYNKHRGEWHIGPKEDPKPSGLYVKDPARHPVDVTGTWYVADSAVKYAQDPDVEVKCSEPDKAIPEWAIILMIIVGVILLLVLIGIIGYCIYDYNRNRKDKDHVDEKSKKAEEKKKEAEKGDQPRPLPVRRGGKTTREVREVTITKTTTKQQYPTSPLPDISNA